MADRDIAVKFTGDASDLVQASNKAERSLADTGKSMGGSLAAIGPYAVAAGAAIAGVAMVAWDFAQAAMEDEAAAAQLAHQLKTAANASDDAIESAEEYIEVLSKQVALADDELRPALSTLATATGDVGKAQELLALSTDIAAGTGKDLETVVNAVAKAQLGSVGGLSKLGLATKDAAGETMALDQILASATEKFRGAGEAAANTSAGGLRKAAIGFEELKESLGAKLLPILGAAAEVFVNKIIPAGEALVAWVEGEWPKVLEQIRPDLEELRATTAEVMTAVSEFWAEWGDEVLEAVTVIVQVYLKYLITEFKAFVFFVRWVVDQIKAFWAEWGDEILFVAGVVQSAMQAMITIVAYGMAIIRGAIAAVSAVLHGDWARAWDQVREVTRLGVDFVVWIMAGWGDRIRGALTGITQTIVAPFERAFNQIADLWNRTVGSLSFSFPDWIPGMGGRGVDVPDIPRFSAFGASLTVIMPPGTDGYDVTRQLSTFARTVADPNALTIAVR